MEQTQRNKLLQISKIMLIVITSFWLVFRVSQSSVYFGNFIKTRPISLLFEFLLPIGALLFSIGLLLDSRTLCIISFGLIFASNVGEYFGIYRSLYGTTLGIVGGWCFLLSAFLLFLANEKGGTLSVICGVLAALLMIFGAIVYTSTIMTGSSKLGAFIRGVNRMPFNRVLDVCFVRPFILLGKSTSAEWRGIISNLHNISYAILFPIVSIIFGIGASKRDLSNISIQNRSSTSPVSNDNAIESLMRLNDLLNRGIITKEEFDKKKTEIINK